MGARPRSRRLPGGRSRQGHRPPVGHRQRGQRRVRPLAGRRLRLGRLGRLRPQGARHHRQGRVGERQAPLRRAGAGRDDRTVHGDRHRRHVRGRVRQRHAALAGDPAGGGVRPPARVHRPRPAAGGAGRAAAPVRPAGQLLGRLRQDADQRGRRRLAALREGGAAIAAGPRCARHRGRQPAADRALPGDPARPRRHVLERRHRHVREGRRRVPRRGRRPRQRRASHRRRRPALPGGRRGGQPRLHAAWPDRVRPRRRAHQQRRDRQLGRRRLLGSRGQPEDPAGPGDRGRRADDGGQERAAGVGRGPRHHPRSL